jgi:transposase
MSKIRQRYDEEFKKNAVKLSYATPKKMKDFASDLGINVGLIYNWRKIYTEGGDKTKLAEQHDSLRQLQLENAELKMENEMLKKQRPTCVTTQMPKNRALHAVREMREGPSESLFRQRFQITLRCCRVNRWC